MSKEKPLIPEEEDSTDVDAFVDKMSLDKAFVDRGLVQNAKEVGFSSVEQMLAVQEVYKKINDVDKASRFDLSDVPTRDAFDSAVKDLRSKVGELVEIMKAK